MNFCKLLTEKSKGKQGLIAAIPEIPLFKKPGCVLGKEELRKGVFTC